MSVVDCPRCLDLMTPALVAACASVGIEHGKSTAEMAQSYLAGAHAREHQ